MSEEEIQRLLKENLKRRAEKKPLMELPPVLKEHETPEEKATREAAEAKKKAQEEAKSRLGPGKEPKGGKGAAEKSTEDLLALLDQYLKAKHDKEIQAAEESFATFKAENDKKKAELELALAEGRITGEEYYATLRALAQAETEQALALIENKIAAEKSAYERAKVDVARIDASPEAKELELGKLREAHEMRLIQLSAESGRVRIDNAKQVIELTKQEFENRGKIEDLLASGTAEAALGPLAEKEAEVNRLLRERLRLREELIRLGGTPEQVAAFDSSTRDLELNKRCRGADQGLCLGASSRLFRPGREHHGRNRRPEKISQQHVQELIQPGPQARAGFLAADARPTASSSSSARWGRRWPTPSWRRSPWWACSSPKEGDRPPSLPPGRLRASPGMRRCGASLPGKPTVPIAKIVGNFKEALVETNDWLRLIEGNTRRLGGGSGVSRETLIEAVAEGMERYYAGALQMMPS